MISVREVPFDDPATVALQLEQQAELAERYGEDDLDLGISPDGVIVTLRGDDAEGEPVACGVARWCPFDEPPGTVELKRLYVRPSHRGHGHSKVLMGALEAAARAAGATRLVLETGTAQPEAMALYERIGYARCVDFGDYKGYDDVRSYSKELPTRVLVINGTMGAGKTTVAAACLDVLAGRGVRSAYVDGDTLCQAEPAPADDRFSQRLFFGALGGAAPAFRAHGYGAVVVPRVVEDPADRDRYAAAFAGPAGPADVAIVRVTASEAERVERLSAREPEGAWRDFALARTVELEEALDGYGLDDAVVVNEGKDRLAAAAEVLEAAGWA